MFIHRSLFPAAIALVGTFAANHLTAQTPRRILALTADTPLLGQVDFPGCTAPSICSPALPATAAPTWAGGTAHDPRDRTTWVTNGGMVMKVDPRTGACSTACGPVPFPALGATEYVTGLAFGLSTQQLFASTTLNRIVRYDASGGGCSLAFVDSCTPSPLPVNHVISGLATDDASSTIIWATAPWLGSSTSPFARIHYASQATPCTPICQGPLQDCAGAFLPQCTGLAYDGCARELYATDGAWIHSAENPAFCFRSVTNCCSTAGSLGERIIGLCVLPSTEVSSGTSCFAGTTPVCGSMSHSLGGDPVLGNLDFSLDLNDCPASSWAFVYGNVGGCTPGTDFSGILCDEVPLSPIGLFLWTGTGSGCTGSATFPLPIPTIPVLCGLTLSTRYWGVSGPPTSNFVSNCLTWMITST